MAANALCKESQELTIGISQNESASVQHRKQQETAHREPLLHLTEDQHPEYIKGTKHQIMEQPSQ